jgi:hypothetical protein
MFAVGIVVAVARKLEKDKVIREAVVLAAFDGGYWTFPAVEGVVDLIAASHQH